MLIVAILPVGEPKACLSTDLHIWSVVTQDLKDGKNPYANPTYHLLNYAPFWMGVLYVLSRISDPFTWRFYFYLRMFLIAGDVTLLASLYWVLGLLDRTALRRRLLLWGFCLNPLLILLTVQHGQFDVFPTICVVLYLGWLIRFERSGDPVDWLTAAACLGIGVFTKTYPLVLWPLLATQVRTLNWRAWVLAAALIAGPWTLSLLPLYILNPDLVGKYVLGYRSFGEDFGLMSLLQLAHVSPLFLNSYAAHFAKILLASTALLAAALARWNLPRQSDRVLVSALILLAVFTLGPGYGQQYWFWVIPLFLICYREYDGPFRKLLWIALWVTVATNVFECAIETWLGGFLSIGLNSQPLLHLSALLFTHPRSIALIHLPMTLCSLTVLAAGIAAIFKNSQPYEKLT